MNPLRALDEIVLPRLARGLRRIVGAVPGVGMGAGSRSLIGVAVLSLVAIGATAIYVKTRPAPVDDTTGDVVRVGVSDGDKVADYLAQTRSELTSLARSGTGETVALVSFDAYREPAALPALLAGVTTVRVYARVPLPKVQTEIVSFPVHTLAADVPAAMKRTATTKERAATEAEQLAAGLNGSGAKEAELRAFYRQDAQVSRAEAGAYRRLCACTYGAVVRADAAALTRLAQREGVRVVDAAPESRRLNRTVFLPLQPEQLLVVTPPADGTLPAPTN